MNETLRPRSSLLGGHRAESLVRVERLIGTSSDDVRWVRSGALETGINDGAGFGFGACRKSRHSSYC